MGRKKKMPAPPEKASKDGLTRDEINRLAAELNKDMKKIRELKNNEPEFLEKTAYKALKLAEDFHVIQKEYQGACLYYRRAAECLTKIFPLERFQDIEEARKHYMLFGEDGRLVRKGATS